jgi:hypothetical protein
MEVNNLVDDFYNAKSLFDRVPLFLEVAAALVLPRKNTNASTSNYQGCWFEHGSYRTRLSWAKTEKISQITRS